MDRYAFPETLAQDVAAKWRRDGSPLPPDAQLREILEVAYLASQETEERRPITFMLCCTPDLPQVRRAEQEGEVEAWRFDTPRDFSLLELRRLAVATDMNATAIWVVCAEDQPLRIRGLLNLGMSWVVARRGFTQRYEPLPRALTIRVDQPGALAVFQDEGAIASLRAGRLSTAQRLNDSLAGVDPLIEEGLGVLGGELTGDESLIRLERPAYLNVLIAILNAVRLRRHGGALLLTSRTSPVLDPDAGFVTPKYRLGGPPRALAEHFLRLVRARHALDLAAPDAPQRHLRFLEVHEANQKLAETCRLVGHLSGADGAIVLGCDLRPAGFGAEIRLDRGGPVAIDEVADASFQSVARLDSEQFGMRHRSAMRLCAAAPGVAAFVVSQDGGVGLVFRHAGRVCFRPNLSLVNARM